MSRTSYNLPDYQVLQRVDQASSSNGHKRSHSRHRPAALPLAPRFAQLQAAQDVPHINSPAVVKSGQRWSPGRDTWRSPLALSSSLESDADVARRLQWLGWTSRAQRPPSKRFTRPPPLSASASCQEFVRSSLPRGLRQSDANPKHDAFYEDAIARSLERKLREKAYKSKVGERAGLGVGAGREMYMLAALGSVRERRLKASLNTRPMSAPPSQQTFSLEASPLIRDPPSSVLLARALGHRKSSSSTSAATPRMQAAPPAKTVRLGSGSGGTLVQIRGFIARRTSATSIPVPMDVVDEVAEVKDVPPFIAAVIEIVLPEVKGAPASPTIEGVNDDKAAEDEAAAMDVDPAPTTFSSSPPASKTLSFPTSELAPSPSPRKRKEPTISSPSLPQRPPPAARPTAQRRHSTLGIPTLPFTLPAAPPAVFSRSNSTPLGAENRPTREVHRPAPSPVQSWTTRSLSSASAGRPKVRHSVSHSFALPSPAVVQPESLGTANGDWRGRSCWRDASDASVGFVPMPRKLAFA